jgi:gamma-glutamylcyclotransferase (GGCT)/AIG2-like uncharacterized protein YtfP
MTRRRVDGSSPASAAGGTRSSAPGPDGRLAVYGSLAPGERNHDLLAHLAGTWFAGTVRGRLRDRGWGAGVGFPGLIPDEKGPEVAVTVLESADLAGLLPALDAFEGEEYRRVEIDVTVDDGRRLRAWIYALAPAGQACRKTAP